MRTRRFIDLTGCRFGMLLALKEVGNQLNAVMWECKCDCGKITRITTGNLRQGRSTSCGCNKSKSISLNRARHGETRGGVLTAEFRAWSGMKDRCENPSAEKYPRYGGRGIKVCEKWQKYENFLSDMGRKPTPKHSIERVDNDKGYDPDNCIWATAEVQANNKSTTRILVFEGRSQSLTQWAREFGIKRSAMRRLVRNGWPLQNEKI